MVAIEGHVESLAELGQHTNRLQASHGHEDAEEEENRTHIDTGEQARHTLLQALAVLGAMEIAVEDLRHRPQRAEHQEDADKRRKVGDALEDGNEEQTADTDPEHNLALSLREVALVLLALAIVLDGHQLPLEMILEDESRGEPWRQGWGGGSR